METKSNTAIVPAENRKAIVRMVEGDKFRQQLNAALVSRIPEEYVLRMAMSCINQDAKLQVCDPLTVAASILQLAQAGLAPEPWKGHGYLIPRRNKEGRYYCTQLIGYRGYLTLAYRSSKVAKADAKPVYAGDIFDLDLGSGNPPIHKPWVKPEAGRESRGEFVGAYAMVKLENGEHLVEWMTKDDIDMIMQRSESAKAGFSPWKTDYVEMARKTPFRRLFKWIPDAELQRIAAMEEAAEFGRTKTIMDVETGEIMTVPVQDEPEHEEMQAPQRKSEVEAPKAVVEAAPEPEKPVAKPEPMPEPTLEPEVKTETKVCTYFDEYGECVLAEGHAGSHEVFATEEKYVRTVNDEERRKLFGAMAKAKPKSKVAGDWEKESRGWIKDKFGFKSTAEITIDKYPEILKHFEGQAKAGSK